MLNNMLQCIRMKLYKLINHDGYKIDKEGNVYTTKYPKGITRKLKQFKRSGYWSVYLSHNGFTKAYRTHRLLAMMFIKNSNNYPHINHIDGKRDNNNLKNLEWCTPSMNALHSFNVLNRKRYTGKEPFMKNFYDGARKLGISRRKLNEDQVKFIRNSGLTIYKLSKQFNMNEKTIKNILLRVTYKDIN